MIEQYKSKSPKETVESIKKLMEGIGVNIIEGSLKCTAGFYSTALRIDKTSLTVNGKGSQPDYALASAYGELVERLLSGVLVRYNYNFSDLDVSRNNEILYEGFEKYDNFNALLEIDLSQKDYRIIQDYFFNNIKNKILSESYEELDSDKVVSLPVSVVDALYNTNGLAYGNDFTEASVQALSEIFERYVNRTVIEQQVTLPRIIDWENYVSKSLKEKINTAISESNIKLEVLDGTFGGEIPVIGILMTNEDDRYFVKFGGHFCFEIALERCFTELFQGRSIDDNFWLEKKYDNDNEFSVKNMEKVMKDGNGYYPMGFFDSIIKTETLAYNFGTNNEEAYKCYISRLKSMDKKIYLKNYSAFEHYVVRYLIPGFSQVVTDTKSIVERYNQVNYNTYNLLNFVDLPDADREQFLTYLSEVKVKRNTPLYSLVKHPVKNHNNFKHITFEYLNSLHHCLTGNFEEAKKLAPDSSINKNIQLLENQYKQNIDGQLKKETITQVMQYPNTVQEKLIINKHNVSQGDELIYLYHALQKYKKKYARRDVLLVSMPFDALDKPSLGIGLLVAASKKQNIDIEAVYTKFDFAERIGVDIYNFFCNFTETSKMPGEYVFSKSLFGHIKRKEYIGQVVRNDITRLKYTNHMLKQMNIDNDYEGLLDYLVEEAEEFVREMAESVVLKKPKIVACSSMFEQNCATLALLKHIKKFDPSIITVMGGANCEGELGEGIIEGFEWVDYVIWGEGDVVFPKLCSMLLTENIIDKKEIPQGVLTKETLNSFGGKEKYATVTVKDIKCPDYDDYFYSFKTFKYRYKIEPMIMVESSRGCWWGEKESRRCRFCGLNGVNAAYRSKNSKIVVEEIAYLKHRYKAGKFFFSDNILSMNCFDALLPELIDSRLNDVNYHIETKANLKEKHVSLLKKANVTWIQPGIENLQDDSLRALGKGTSAIKNIQLLKHAKQYQLNTVWNYLTGIPDEKKHWYEEVVCFIDSISHLQPPTGIYKLRFDRFSKYEQEPEKYNINLSENQVYSLIYHLDQPVVKKLCRFYEDRNNNNVNDYDHVLQQKIYHWMNEYYSKKPTLVIYENDNKGYIRDTRACAIDKQFVIEDTLYYIVSCCHESKEIKQLQKDIESRFGVTLTEKAVIEGVDELVQKKILLRIKNSVLSLAIPTTFCS